MDPYFRKGGVERRRGPDLLVRAIRWVSLVGWSLLFIALLIFEKAKPVTDTFFDRLFNTRVFTRLYWNRELVEIIFILMWIGLFTSIIGLIINSKRHRRKTDEYRFNLVFMGILSFLGILIYLL